jgi:hypothetical protein
LERVHDVLDIVVAYLDLSVDPVKDILKATFPHGSLSIALIFLDLCIFQC